jgi:hypothetical protein
MDSASKRRIDGCRCLYSPYSKGKKMMDNVVLLLSDARGIMIPRDFVEQFSVEKFTGISEWAIQTCQNPDNEGYWDAWDDILNNARYTEDGKEYSLYQDGDLWLICYEHMTTEERTNFGFDE